MMNPTVHQNMNFIYSIEISLKNYHNKYNREIKIISLSLWKKSNRLFRELLKLFGICIKSINRIAVYLIQLLLGLFGMISLYNL
jgi:hypothetical protein